VIAARVQNGCLELVAVIDPTFPPQPPHPHNTYTRRLRSAGAHTHTYTHKHIHTHKPSELRAIWMDRVGVWVDVSACVLG